MSDWIGLIFFVLLIVAAWVGLRTLSKPTSRTEADHERNVADSFSKLGAGVNALQDALNPEAPRSKEVIAQMKDGRYQKKKQDGKSGGNMAEPDDVR